MLGETDFVERFRALEAGSLSAAQIAEILRSGFTDQEKARCEYLSYRVQDGTLSPAEERGLDALIEANAWISALKAKAQRHPQSGSSRS